MTNVWDIPVYDPTRIRDVRSAAEEAARRAGFGILRGASAALVATEMTTNLLRHGGGGQVLIETLPHAAGARPSEVQILAVDHGPGISDLAAAVRDGVSGASSLGAGLGTCQRTADVFDIHSVPGRGTVALAQLFRTSHDRPRHAACAGTPARVGGLHLPMAGVGLSGDAWTCWASRDVLNVVVVDGLGHGPDAAEASDAAVRRFHENPDLPPDLLLRELDAALRRTRGAAAAVVRIDTRAGRLHHAGIGNVTARLRTGDRWHHLLSRPGIVGVHRPSRIQVEHHPWDADSLLVIHSDGLPSRWEYRGDGDLARRDPATIAAVLLRDAGSPASLTRDDTTVVAVTADPS
ncbi:SpoIIE family protein phosphatase [Thermobifida halotolerans]|uniref:SpoIIE family protein phosphatase n=1 Tax=Thermobifida halotolerans TaxID=483545 RepID=A0A399FUM1_9ACTN|nr:ATP-binding SpoIIE family protein phosphatase [Thermobifida halotolerans]UOE19066.1 SpoIIE family protein phosphatase [Thermobifida halotolerans]